MAHVAGWGVVADVRVAIYRNADQIVVVQGESIAEQGSHEELMAIPDGLYRHLNLVQARLQAEEPVVDQTLADAAQSQPERTRRNGAAAKVPA